MLLTIQQDIITGVRFLGAAVMLIAPFVMAFMHRGRVQSQVYNTSRWLLVVGTAILGIHNCLMFFGHYREESHTMAWMINILSYMPVTATYNLAEVNLLRAGHRLKKYITTGCIAFGISISLLIVGNFTDTIVNDSAPWLTTTFWIAITYTTYLVFITTWLHQDMQGIRSKLTDVELQDRHKVLTYTAQSMRLLMLCSFITPWIGMSDSLVLNGLFGLIIFPLMCWYLNSFVLYGHDMSEVIDVEDEIIEAEVQKRHNANYTNNIPSDLNDIKQEDALRISNVVSQWVAERKYINPSMNIAMATKQMGLSSQVLNYYLRYTLNIEKGYRQWVSNLRLEEAKRQMLLNPKYTLDAIAEQCGFANRRSLSNAFHKQFGISPTQWLEDEQNKQNN